MNEKKMKKKKQNTIYVTDVCTFIRARAPGESKSLENGLGN